jgi:tryptophan-rich sensory protein
MTARYASLAALLVAVVAASLIAGSYEAGEWYYRDLNRPDWTPSSFVWGIGWSLSYLFLAVAAWQLWLSGHYARLTALAWWLLLLALVVAWSLLFFGLNRVGWAWMELTAALGVFGFCYRAFRPLSAPAARTLLPAAVWLLFIWALNFVLWSTNGGPLTWLEEWMA